MFTIQRYDNVFHQQCILQDLIFKFFFCIFIERALYLFYPAPLQRLYTAKLCGDSVPTASSIGCMWLKSEKKTAF